MPNPLGERYLQCVVIAYVLVLNFIDVGQIGELAEVRPGYILADRADRRRSSGRAARLGCAVVGLPS